MEAIFSAVLTTSFYATIVGLAVIFIKSILRNQLSPKWHYFIWVVLILKLLIPFGPESAFSLFNFIPKVFDSNIIISEGLSETHNNSSVILPTENEIDNNIFYNMPIEQNVDNRAINKAEKAKANPKIIFSYFWLSGSLFILFWLLYTYLSFYRKLSKRTYNIDQRIISIFEQCKKRIGVNRKLTLTISNAISTPALFGVINPKIVLTPQIAKLKDREIEYVLLHELAHYRRKDVLVNYILIIFQVVHWFNPVIWYCFKCIREDMEIATDEKVLSILQHTEHKDYGMVLVTILENFQRSMVAPRLLGMADDKKSIERRIRMIKMASFFKSKKNITIIIGVVCVLILGGIFLTNGISADNKDRIRSEDGSNEDKVGSEDDSNKDKDRSVDTSLSETSENQAFEIYVFPDKYTLLMSSTPGIRILAKHSEYKGKVRYSTENGVLFTWDRDIGKISDSAKSIEQPYGSPVYWSAIDENGKVFKGESDIVKITLLDSKGNEIDNKNITIRYDGEMYYTVDSPFVIVGYEAHKTKTLEEAISNAIKEQGKSYRTGEFIAEGHIILDKEEKDSILKVYTMASVGCFGFEDDMFTKISGSGAIPTVITFLKNENGEYFLLEYKEPLDGKGYTESIKEMFPKELQDEVVSAHEKYPELVKQQEEQAANYIKSIGRKESVSSKYNQKTRPDIDREARDELFSIYSKFDSFINACPDWLGTREYIEDGTRYIYETSQTKTVDGHDLIIFNKTKENGTVIEERRYKIVGSEVELVDYTSESEKEVSILKDDKVKAFDVITKYFYAFSQKDYNKMRTFSTDRHNEEYMHDGDVWGMKWAMARDIDMVNHDFLRIDNKQKTIVFGVSVYMETVKTSSQYPSSQTFFYITLIKDEDGTWRVDQYMTG